MIEQIENLEKQFDSNPNQKVLDGFACIHLCLNMTVTGNDELIKALDNGRR